MNSPQISSIGANRPPDSYADSVPAPQGVKAQETKRASNSVTFAERAAGVALYGIPLMPLRPRTKDAFLKDWQSVATTDETQIAKWSAENPAYNCAAVARSDGFWVWDIDDPTVFERLEKDTGHTLDELDTLIVKSSGEKRHIYFKHDECSRIMSNRNCDIGGKEVFSVRAHNRYVVAAGSIHPETGELYEVMHEPIFGKIPVAPPWLTDWIMRCASRPQAPATDSVEVPITIPEGGRDNWLFEQACKLRDDRYPQKTVLSLLRELNKECCKPPMSDSVVKQKVESAFIREPRGDARSEYLLRVDDVTEFINEKLPARPMLLSPFLAERTLGMVHAWRGVGKTHIMLGMAAATASGGQFLKWKAPQPSPVVYVDGEMADEDIQLWLRETMALDGIPQIQPGYLKLIAADRQDRSIPSLSTSTGQNMVRDQIGDAKSLYLDNISCLFRGGDEKEGTDWESAQEWLISLRREGISVILGHHDGKGLTQRGTSKREDPLNWVIQLKHPKNYHTEEGLRCEIHFEKARRLFGADARPFEASLITGPHGKTTWTIKEMQDALADSIRQMHSGEGMSFREIGKDLNLSKSQVERLFHKALAPIPSTENPHAQTGFYVRA
jgi:hypothetical protein